MKKAFKDLDLRNSFLFAAAMADEETCRLVLEIILEHELHVNYNVEMQNRQDYRTNKGFCNPAGKLYL